MLLQIQYRLIAIKIQIVFQLNWILKVNSRKSVFFRLLLFSFLFFVVSKKEELYEYKSLENSGQFRIRERLLGLFRDISKSFFKNYGFSLTCIEEKRPRSNTGEHFRLMASVQSLNSRNSHFIFIGANGIFQIVSFKTMFGFCFFYLSWVNSNLIR